MKTIYQFGFQIHDDSKQWAKEISLIFEKPFSITSYVHDFPNKEKNWIESVKPDLITLSNFNFFGYTIIEIHASFNRFQSYVYFTLIFSENIVNDYSYFEKIRNHLSKQLVGFVDNFEIPFKEAESENESDKYNEILTLENPSVILEHFQNTNYVETKIKSGKFFYVFDYKPQNKECYSRVFKQVYISNDENHKEIINHFHSIFVLFHRSYTYYNELQELDSPRKLLFEMSNAFNNIWPTERMHLFMLNRITNSHLYNRTFFGVLEITAQIDTILSQVIVRNQKLKDKYEKQYERVLHNFRLDSLNDKKMYDELINYLKKPYHFRNDSINNIKSLYEPTDAQINRLRSDNDSRVNFAIQSIMSILSIIIFLWGLIAVWYQTTISYPTSLIDQTLFKNQYFPATFTTLAASTALFSIGIAYWISKRQSNTFSNSVKDVIKSKSLNYEKLYGLLNEINSCKTNNNRLLLITKIFNMLTAFTILNMDNPKIINEHLEKMVEIIRKVDVCK